MDQPTQTFHPFARLPLELRLGIWTHAILEPRMIAIKVKSKYVKGQEELLFVTPTPVPWILLVNHESRVQANELYNQEFCCGYEPRYIYTNLKTDTIHTTPDSLTWFSNNERRHLRRLRLDIRDDNCPSLNLLKASTADMPLLEVFELVSSGLEASKTNLVYDYGNLMGMRDLFVQKYRHILGWECPIIRLIKSGSTLELRPGADTPVHTGIVV